MVRPVTRRCSRCGTPFLGGDAVVWPPVCYRCENANSIGERLRVLPDKWALTVAELADTVAKQHCTCPRPTAEKDKTACLSCRSRGYRLDLERLAMEQAIHESGIDR